MGLADCIDYAGLVKKRSSRQPVSQTLLTIWVNQSLSKLINLTQS